MFTPSARGQRGVTLIEIMLWCAIIAAATVAIFVFGHKASVTAAVQKEQRQVEDIVKAVDSMFMLQPNFAALGTDGAQYLSSRGAARSGLNLTRQDDGASSLSTSLGSGQLNLSVWDVDTGSLPVVPNSGYRLAYQGLAASECSRLVTAIYPIAYRVSVDHNGLDDASATVLTTRGQTTVSPAVIAENCSGAADDATVFLYFAPARAIAASTPTTPAPATSCAATRETQYTACPPGQIGTVTQQRDGACIGPGNTMIYTAWATVDDTCQAAPMTPVTVAPMTSVDDCTISTFTQVLACSLGQTGQIIQQRDLDTCAGTYTPWTTLSTSCQPAPPAATCIPSVQQQTIACPSGQGGQEIQERSSTCLSATATLTWSAWNTISNTCTASCVATGTCCTVQRQDQTTLNACGAGNYGDYSQYQERFLNCVNSTTQASSWTGWNTLSSTGSCNACPPTTTETEIRWASRTDSCPSGQSGSITYEAEQVRTRDQYYSCPAGTASLPAPSYTAWTGWADTGLNRNVVNSCAPTATPSTCSAMLNVQSHLVDANDPSLDPAGTTYSCGDFGAWEASCSAGDVCSVQNLPGRSGTGWSTWMEYDMVCTGSCAVPSCTAPASTTSSISRALANQNQNIGCPSGYAGDHWQTRTVAESGTRTTSWSCPGPTSTDTDTWSGTYSFGAWTTTSDTCAAVSCSGPSSETQWVPTSGSCSAGYWGTPSWEREQMRSRTCTSGTWGAYGAWSDTGATRNATGPCAACPAGYTETGTQWVASSAACPSGYSGSNTWEREQIHSRSVSYSCPAGTTSSPAPSYGGWSGWTDTGSTRNTVNTCAPVAMCAVVVSNNYSVENGGDGRELASYSINGAWTNASCYERDHNCSPSSIFSVGAWAAACRSGDEYWLTSSPFGYTSTDWVNQVESVYHCQPCP